MPRCSGGEKDQHQRRRPSGPQLRGQMRRQGCEQIVEGSRSNARPQIAWQQVVRGHSAGGRCLSTNPLPRINSWESAFRATVTLGCLGAAAGHALPTAKGRGLYMSTTRSSRDAAGKAARELAASAAPHEVRAAALEEALATMRRLGAETRRWPSDQGPIARPGAGWEHADHDATRSDRAGRAARAGDGRSRRGGTRHRSRS